MRSVGDVSVALEVAPTWGEYKDKMIWPNSGSTSELVSMARDHPRCSLQLLSTPRVLRVVAAVVGYRTRFTSLDGLMALPNLKSHADRSQSRTETR